MHALRARAVTLCLCHQELVDGVIPDVEGVLTPFYGIIAPANRVTSAALLTAADRSVGRSLQGSYVNCTDQTLVYYHQLALTDLEV
jgi:formylmethanofuran:tetrahydromethanopterin formyltransferase